MPSKDAQKQLAQTSLKDQAGLRSNRSTNEQISQLRNILKQANEWRVALYMHFADFQKALLIRSTEKACRRLLLLLSSKIIISYGISAKMLRVIADKYQDFECAAFSALLAMDWIRRRAKADKKRGIPWNFMTVLGEIDFENGRIVLPRLKTCLRRLRD